jgi:F420-dependent oxidoreductase-like protein
MKLGLQIYSFTWPGGPEAIGPTLARAVRTADDAGFDSIWVMDHFWQIGGPGSELQPMLEGWTTLGFMAAHSQRARLGLMVGGVHYRNPGLWVKAATTLDVLSGGRAWLGIGAAWNQAESEGLGFPWPSTSERFEMLEDTLRIAYGMWQGERGSEEDFQGRRFRATRLLNVPQSISRPRVPIMIGGGGERKTLRLVAQYADASNLFGGPDQVLAKYAILAQHCAAVGRDFAEIERTNLQGVGLGSGGAWSRAPESPDAIVERFGRLAEAGVQHVIVNFTETNDTALIELLGSRVLPQLRGIVAADPRHVTATVAGGR